jgi:AraC-like DNA-binding protein
MSSSRNNYLSLRLVRMQRSDEWEDYVEGLSFILLKEGKGIYSTKKSTWNLLPGDVIVASSTSGGKLTVQSNMIFWSFTVCFEQLLPLFSPEEICLLQNIVDNFRQSKVYHASNPLARECHWLAENVPPEGNVDHRSQLLRVAAAVLAAELLTARNQRNGFARGESRVVQVFESLSTKELLTLSVEELANKFSCSRRHLNRLFHQHFGYSMATLRMELRLLKAVSLLRDPEVKVINVAEQCGFNHLGLFNTCFRRRFGTSPGQWRKTGSTAVPFSDLSSKTQPAKPTPENHGVGYKEQGATARVITAKVNQIMEKAGAASGGGIYAAGRGTGKENYIEADAGCRPGF